MVMLSCQTSKKSKGPTLVGENVRMVELRRAIQTQIPDPRRSAALLEITGHAEREMGAINTEFAERSLEFGKMSGNYKKTGNELSAFLSSWDSHAGGQRKRLMNTMLAMKTQTTPAEWPGISNAFLSSVMSQSDRYTAMRRMAY